MMARRIQQCPSVQEMCRETRTRASIPLQIVLNGYMCVAVVISTSASEEHAVDGVVDDPLA